MKIKKFEDLECWQESGSLTKQIYKHTKRPSFFKNLRLSG